MFYEKHIFFIKNKQTNKTQKEIEYTFLLHIYKQTLQHFYYTQRQAVIVLA